MNQPILRRPLPPLVPPPPAEQVQVPEVQPAQPHPVDALELEMPSSAAVAGLGHGWPRMLGLSRY